MQPEIADAGEHWLDPSVALSRLHPSANAAIGLRPSVSVQPTRFGFRIGQLHFLLKPKTHSEVMVQPHVYPIPNVPAWFLGVLNLRGNVLPVFELHQFLQAGSSNRHKCTVLLLDRGRDAVGVSIDGLPQVVALNQALHEIPSLPDGLQEHVAAAYVTDGTIWLDFDHQSFFTALGRHITS